MVCLLRRFQLLVRLFQREILLHHHVLLLRQQVSSSAAAAASSSSAAHRSVKLKRSVKTTETYIVPPYLLHVLVLRREVGDLPGQLVADGLAAEDGLAGGLPVGQHAPQPLRLLLGLSCPCHTCTVHGTGTLLRTGHVRDRARARNTSRLPR